MVSRFKLVTKNWEATEPVFRFHTFKLIVRKYCIDPNAPRHEIAQCEITFRNKVKKPRVVPCSVVVSKTPKDQEGDHTITVKPLHKLDRSAVSGKIIINHRMKSRFELPFCIFKSKSFENKSGAWTSSVRLNPKVDVPSISVTFRDPLVCQDSHNDIFECYRKDAKHYPSFIVGRTTLFRKTLTWTQCSPSDPEEKNYLNLCPQCFTTSTSGFLKPLQEHLSPAIKPE
jgi:hypothetical protein